VRPRRPKTRPTPEKVREILRYIPETGAFVWQYREDRSPQWNGSWAGEFAGTLNQDGFIRIGIDGRVYHAAQLAWVWMRGEWPENDVRHLDHDPENNRWENLYSFAKDGKGRRPQRIHELLAEKDARIERLEAELQRWRERYPEPEV